MENKIRMIALDLDGTTLSENKKISPRVKAAIEKAIENGIIVLPATGRQMNGVPEEFLQIKGVQYVLSANGALVYDRKNKKEIYTDYFSQQTALSILQYVQSLDVLISVYMNEKGYTETLNFEGYEGIISENIREYMKNSRTIVENLEEEIRKNPSKIEKISIVFKDEKERLKALEELKARKDNCTTSSITMNLEINTSTANKGTALLALGEYLNIKPNEIMAVGDGGNDKEMILAAGFGVAMGNADQDLKEVANFVTDDCEHDGVAVAIEKILECK